MKSHELASRARVAALAGAAALALLSACGGGGGGTTDAPTPTPVDTTVRPLSVNGTVTGFGSVIIDGVRYDDTTVQVAVDNGGATGTTVTLGELKLGMSVDAKVDNGKLTEVTLRSAITGPVASIDLAGSSFMIYGQPVKVVTSGATPTLFEGVSGLSGLAVNDRVEVHGTVDANKAIVATRVERKPRDANEVAVKISGVVTTLDNTAKTFKFNDLTVDFSSAVVRPSNLSLANGQLVFAFGDAAPSGGRFTAKAVRIKAAEDGAPAALGGRITAFTSLSDLSLAGVKVNAGTATLDGGVAADLVVGQSIAVEGKMQSGVLVADKVRILKTSVDALSSLKGEVSDFVSAANFKLRGTTVDAANATFVSGTVADLANGAYVTVQGAARGDVFRAEKVEFLKPTAAQTVKVTGEVRDWDATARTFKVLAMSMKLASGVDFDSSSLARMANGRKVAVVGLPDADGVVQVSKLSVLEDPSAPAVSVLGGRASDVAPSSFKLPGGITVTHSSATIFEGGTSADIANGALVFAKGRVDGTAKTMFATWVEIVKGESTAARVAGQVSDVVSLSDFRIGGQRVDASSAQLVDGQATALTAGAVVMATGSLAERSGVRVFVATKLRFMQ